MNVLSAQSTNAKLSKNAWISSDWESSILYLAPADEAGTGVSLCPASTEGCRKACLYSAGRGTFESVRNARIAKARWFVNDQSSFLAALVSDLEFLVRKQTRTGVRQAVRLNGTSDIRWESLDIVRDGKEFFGVPQAFPELVFYDYTKMPDRCLSGLMPINYHLTFSVSESTPDRMIRHILRNGTNAAIVFRDRLPPEFLGHKVIDGTTHDMRFTDPTGVIVGLTAKGKAKRDDSGFVKEV